MKKTSKKKAMATKQEKNNQRKAEFEEARTAVFKELIEFLVKNSAFFQGMKRQYQSDMEKIEEEGMKPVIKAIKEYLASLEVSIQTVLADVRETLNDKEHKPLPVVSFNSGDDTLSESFPSSMLLLIFIFRPSIGISDEKILMLEKFRDWNNSEVDAAIGKVKNCKEKCVMLVESFRKSLNKLKEDSPILEQSSQQLQKRVYDNYLLAKAQIDQIVGKITSESFERMFVVNMVYRMIFWRIEENKKASGSSSPPTKELTECLDLLDKTSKYFPLLSQNLEQLHKETRKITRYSINIDELWELICRMSRLSRRELIEQATFVLVMGNTILKTACQNHMIYLEEKSGHEKTRETRKSVEAIEKFMNNCDKVSGDMLSQTLKEVVQESERAGKLLSNDQLQRKGAQCCEYVNRILNQALPDPTEVIDEAGWKMERENVLREFLRRDLDEKILKRIRKQKNDG